MSSRGVYFKITSLVTLFIIGITNAADEIGEPVKKTLKSSDSFDKNAVKDHYPIAWAKVDAKAIIDNDRLFKKYKECLTTNHPVSCPRMVMEFKTLIPEIVETLCSKCLPVHIVKFKETVEYICHTRRADYDEVRREKDPDGVVQAKFEAQFGKVNC